ncbi:MAG TPA: PEP-CTERM sorting domain-containing protein [Terriglobales bacterium]|nr:PEP-CTERM sorting domain-containing protein [Terriglobales bacterium]
MGKKILLMLAFALVLPMAAYADNVSFTTDGGFLWADSHGLIVSNATLVNVDGVAGANLGTVSFSTGLMNSPGSVLSGASFRGPGAVNITGIGGTALFSGVFSQNPTWTVISTATSTLYTFTGIATGVLNGNTNAVLQFTFTLDGKAFKSNPTLQPSSMIGIPINVTAISVPEPSSMAFMGTGLLGLMGAIRRKYRKQAIV